MKTSRFEILPFIYKNHTDLFFSGFLALLLLAFSVKSVSPFFLGGRSFDDRSLTVQIIYCLGLWVIYTAILAVMIILANNSMRKITQPMWIGKITGWITTLDRSHWVIPLAGIVGITSLLVLTLINLKIITFPFQMEYREGAIVLTGEAFLRGINPWAIENNPVYINVYGFFYNWLLMPFIWIFGNQVWIYRAGSFLAILGQIGLLTAVLRQRQVRWSFCTIAAAFLWLGQIYYTTPLARPDALGQFLFLASLLIPMLDKYSTKSIVVSGLMAVLGFYTKPYFVLGLPILAVYLFLFVNKKKAVLYALLTGAVLAVTAVVINRFYDAYFMNVVFSHVADTNRFFDYMLQQTWKFLADYWILLVILLGVVYLSLKGILIRISQVKLDLIQFSKPVLLDIDNVDLAAFSLVIGAFLVYFSLGRHNGTIQAYYYQLLTPFLLMLVIPVLQKMSKYQGITLLLVCANLLIHGWQNLKSDFAPYPVDGWAKLNAEIVQANHILNSPSVVTSLIQYQRTVVNSGQSPYYYPLPESPNFFYPDLKTANEVGENYRSSIKDGLEQGKYDLFLADSSYQSRNAQRYFQQMYPTKDVVSLVMPHTGQEWIIWVKKPVNRK